jgi:SAM-dependent methyltransferase
LRLKKNRKYDLEFELGNPSLPVDNSKFHPLKLNPDPELDLSGLRVPRHLTKEILSYFPKAKSPNSLMLDLGCGGGIHKDVCEAAGFEWVGLDYEASGAPILGDAHSLPFMDDSFEFILCVTVLQYVRYPFVMMREAYRALKPGGKFIGTVAFLEPSHGTSFYHHSHLGAFNSLQYGGFTVEQIAPSEKWSVLMALASMGLFHGLPRALSQAIIFPLQLVHKLWWQFAGLITGRNLNELRIRHFTGSFTFIATKDDKGAG